MCNSKITEVSSLASKKPKHIAIIMDGNNRYGKMHGMEYGGGHRSGKDALDEVVNYSRTIGIQVLTVFAFSSENWQRPKDEVALLMNLLEVSVNEQLPRMLKYGIRMRFIGDRSQLSEHLQSVLLNAEEKTAHLNEMTLVIAISYGGQWDIVSAAKKLAIQVRDDELNPESIDTSMFNKNIELGDLPAVDLLIRTGGEWRISNFLLWQSAYAELYFTKVLWPDFGKKDIEDAITFFGGRERRFGKTTEQVNNSK